jgi:hypothetical protein
LINFTASHCVPTGVYQAIADKNGHIGFNHFQQTVPVHFFVQATVSI